jgi:hypothetical protein
MTLSIFSVMSRTVPVAKAQGDVDVYLKPGAPDPYKPGFSHTLGTLRDNPDEVVASYLDYAILTDSVGDLQFDLTVNVLMGYIDIFYPCEFTFTRGTTDEDAVFSVWTDITNDYGFIAVSVDDCQVTIGSHADLDGTLVIEPNLYHVRLLAMKAPAAFGAYYFEIDVDGTAIPQEDWPIIVVKGELNPAYITGIVEADSGLTDLKVEAKGTTPEGRSVEGLFYFAEDSIFDDGTGDYTYWLFGAPAGTYEVTASAIDDGYAPDTSDRFSVNAGQSHHTPDLSLSLGPLVAITVWSKHGRGTLPWGCLWQPPYGTNDPTTPPDMCGDAVRDMHIYIYDEAGEEVTSVLDEKLDPEAVSFSTTLTALESGKTYTLAAYVTGYVMVDEDAWQRTFTVAGDEMSIGMDLRRSNWFEITAHTITPNNDMTLVYTAVQDGEEKGMAVYRVPAGTDAPTIILEGWNARTSLDAAEDKDYGLAPGTYEIKLYAADGTPPDPVAAGAVEGVGWYYINAGEPTMASIALCNSPSALSFEVSSITLTLKLRSVDWESPSHPRPWTFPGAEIWVDFVDESTGEVADSLDPTVWGLVQDDGNIGSPYYDFPPTSACALPDGSSACLQITWTGNDVVDVADALDGTLPTNIAPGEYNFAVNTFAYLSRRVFPVWVPDGGNGDIQADLIQGGEIAVGVSFTKEDQDVDFNGFVRVEVYDSDGNLKGANIYGQAVASWDTTVDGTGSYSHYVPDQDWKLIPCAAEGSNIDDADGDECGDGQRGFTSSGFYNAPMLTWANWPNTNPSYANRLALPGGETALFDVFGFYWYYGGPSSRNEGLWANGWETTDGAHQNDHGLAGSRDISPNFLGAGTYTVKVYAFDPLGADGVFGTADDWASYYADAVENIDLPWGAGQLVSVSLAEMGRLSGSIRWTDMYGDRRAMPWAMLTASSPEVVTYTLTPEEADYQYTEPAYFMWLPAGTHDVAVSVAGAPQVFEALSFTVAMSDGFRGTGDQRLDPTGVPVPEFSAGTALALLSALSASIYLLRRRRIAKN